MRSLAVGAILLGLAALPVRAQSIEERLPACLACHGTTGQSEIPGVPSLGAQPAFYLTAQLYLFRERLRAVEPMSEMLEGVSDADLQKLAEIISKLPAPQSAAGPVDTARAEHARTLIQRSKCNSCHTPNFAGQENVPRLAGQREDYLLKSLRAYKNNSRRGYDDQMADVVQPLSDADFADLAYFLARQP
jgi:cytochrome c553